MQLNVVAVLLGPVASCLLLHTVWAHVSPPAEHVEVYLTSGLCELELAPVMCNAKQGFDDVFYHRKSAPDHF